MIFFGCDQGSVSNCVCSSGFLFHDYVDKALMWRNHISVRDMEGANDNHTKVYRVEEISKTYDVVFE